MKISIISGSSRNNSQSEKEVAYYIQATLEEKALCDQTWLYSLKGNPLPLWDESIWDRESTMAGASATDFGAAGIE